MSFKRVEFLLATFWRFVGINTLIFILILLVPTFMSVIFNTEYIYIFLYITCDLLPIIVFLPSFTMQVKGYMI